MCEYFPMPCASVSRLLWRPSRNLAPRCQWWSLAHSCLCDLRHMLGACVVESSVGIRKQLLGFFFLGSKPEQNLVVDPLMGKMFSPREQRITRARCIPVKKGTKDVIQIWMAPLCLLHLLVITPNGTVYQKKITGKCRKIGPISKWNTPNGAELFQHHGQSKSWEGLKKAQIKETGR